MSFSRVFFGAAALGAAAVVVAKLVAKKMADAQFDGMDTDGDGRVTRGEHAAAAKRMFDAMDANQDGRVTAAEMDAAHEKVTGRKRKRGEMTSKAKIAKVDRNGDGVLSRNEHREGARKMFGKMDRNVDGSLSREELAAGHAPLRRKRK